MEDERRTLLRRRTLKAGKIVFGDYRYTLDCTIRNVSDTGVQIRCNTPHDVPAEFVLFDVSDGTLQKVEVIWRSDRDFGLRYAAEAISIHESQDPRHYRFKFI